MKKNILMMVVLSILALTSCTKKEDVVVSPYHIGQIKDYGEIFYIDNSGQHGLICSVLNVSNGMKWCDGDYPIITDTAFGKGLSNTYSIIGVNLYSDYVAYQCQLFSRGAFHDWYLPSKAELNQLYLVHNKIPSFDSSFNGFYWSSSSYGKDGKYAWAQNFNTGEQVYLDALHDRVACAMAIRNF